jgi:hypothetical protein
VSEPTIHPPQERTGRRRGVLAGLALLLACFTIVIATAAVWVHQVALDTDRFTGLVTDVVDDPAVVEPIAARVSQQVVTALEIESRVAELLPDRAAPLARPLTEAVREAIDQRLQRALSNPDVQAAFLRVLSATHSQVVAFLRGDTAVLTVEDGYLQLNVFPVVGVALTELQSIGLIPADVQLPDLSADEAPAVVAERLETALGITLPADFGTVQLMQADGLATAQTAVRAFDVVVITLIVLSVLLIALAIWLARDRRRMVVYAAVGTVVAVLIARLALRGAASVVVGGIADEGVQRTVVTILDATVQDLIDLTTYVLVGAIALAVVAYVAGRPPWLVRLSSRSAGAVSSTASRTTALASDAGARSDLRPAIRENRTAIERAGFAAIAFALVWLFIGLEVALLGAALLAGWLLIVRLVTDQPDVEASGPDPGR